MTGLATLAAFNILVVVRFAMALAFALGLPSCAGPSTCRVGTSLRGFVVFPIELLLEKRTLNGGKNRLHIGIAYYRAESFPTLEECT